MKQPFVSVVIPTCERPELLARCLDHMLRSVVACGRQDLEILVTDASTSGDTRRLIEQRFPSVRWVAGPRGGPAQNRNFGASAAYGRYVFFTDDDDYPSEGWIAAYLEAIGRHAQVKVFEGRTVADRPQQRLDEEAPVNSTGGYLWGCNMAVERHLFLSMGGFCEDFPGTLGCEDVDFRLRLVEAGEPFQFVPHAEICHPYRPTKGLAFQWRAGRSYLLLAERHPQILGSRPLLNVFLNTMRLLKQLLRPALHCRLRGICYALGRIGIVQGYALTAALTRHSKYAEGEIPPA